jgi:hypothetical protein
MGAHMTERPTTVDQVRAWDRIATAPADLTQKDVDLIAAGRAEVRAAVLERRDKALQHSTPARLTSELLDARWNEIEAQVDNKWGRLIREHPKQPLPLRLGLVMHEILVKFCDEMNENNKKRNARLDKLESENIALKAKLTALETKGLMTYEGVWTRDRTYARGAAVTDHGCMWISKTTNTNQRPAFTPEAATYWTLVVKKGKDGKDLR